MRSDPADRKITAAEFLAMDFGTDKKFELEDGVIVMMTGGTEAHAWVQGNIHSWLRQQLRGTGCRPYNADMAVQVSDTEVRCPDISIYCDQPPRSELSDRRTLINPRAVIEVLSPRTTTLDEGTSSKNTRPSRAFGRSRSSIPSTRCAAPSSVNWNMAGSTTSSRA